MAAAARLPLAAVACLALLLGAQAAGQGAGRRGGAAARAAPLAAAAAHAAAAYACRQLFYFTPAAQQSCRWHTAAIVILSTTQHTRAHACRIPGAARGRGALLRRRLVQEPAPPLPPADAPVLPPADGSGAAPAGTPPAPPAAADNATSASPPPLASVEAALADAEHKIRDEVNNASRGQKIAAGVIGGTILAAIIGGGECGAAPWGAWRGGWRCSRHWLRTPLAARSAAVC